MGRAASPISPRPGTHQGGGCCRKESDGVEAFPQGRRPSIWDTPAQRHRRAVVLIAHAAALREWTPSLTGGRHRHAIARTPVTFRRRQGDECRSRRMTGKLDGCESSTTGTSARRPTTTSSDYCTSALRSRPAAEGSRPCLSSNSAGRPNRGLSFIVRLRRMELRLLGPLEVLTTTGSWSCAASAERQK